MSLAEQFKQQALPLFRHVYLRIHELEQLCKEDDNHLITDEGSTVRGLSSTMFGRGKHPFQEAMDAELRRLRLFIEAYSEELWVRLSSTLDRLEHCIGAMKSPSKRSILNEDALDLVEKECNEMAESLISLEEFQRQNILAAALLLQQYDTQSQEKTKRKLGAIKEVNSVYLKQVEESLIGQRGNDVILLALSRAYAKIRKLRDRALGEEGVWEPPDTFTRNTKKYWIHPADILRVKCLILKHLPILIFGRLCKESSVASRLVPLKEQPQKEYSLVSSVYLDNKALQTYHDRLIREHQAALVRCRWYGKKSASSEDSVFVERKVHKDGWTGEKSYKERAPLPSKEIQSFLDGKIVPSMNDKNHKISLLKDLQDHILLRNERPSLRTEYRRVAFQESSSNRVRMSLDTHLRMIKEKRISKRDDEWCRNLDFNVDDSEIVHFPYAVFEIKIQGDDVPDWVLHLLSTGLLVEVPKFSKFLHGMALLYGSDIRNSPSWFIPNDQGFMKPATIEEMADNSDPYAKHAADFLFPEQLPVEHDEKNTVLSRNTQQQMQVSTLCHIPDHHTVLSEVVVLPSGHQHSSNSRRVVHTSVHGTTSRHSANHSRTNIEMTVRGAKDRNWRRVLPWRRHEDPDSDSAGDGNRVPALVRTRIEPKTFFANERTFLSWLTVAVMVMFLGLSLLDVSTTRSGLGLFGVSTHCRSNSGRQIQIHNSTSPALVQMEFDEERRDGIECNVAKVSGALIAPMALILMVYSLYMYRKRSIQILRRETVRYDDPYGPIILTILLVTVLFLAYILSIA